LFLRICEIEGLYCAGMGDWLSSASRRVEGGLSVYNSLSVIEYRQMSMSRRMLADWGFIEDGVIMLLLFMGLDVMFLLALLLLFTGGWLKVNEYLGRVLGWD